MLQIVENARRDPYHGLIVAQVIIISLIRFKYRYGVYIHWLNDFYFLSQ